MIPLTYKENESYKKHKVCYICKKGFSTDDDNREYHKSEINVVIMLNLEELLIVFVT